MAQEIRFISKVFLLIPGIVCMVRGPLQQDLVRSILRPEVHCSQDSQTQLGHFHIKCGRYQLSCSLHIHRLNFMITSLLYILSEKMCVFMNACHFVQNLFHACCSCCFDCLLSVTRTLLCFSMSKYMSLLLKNVTVSLMKLLHTLLGCQCHVE